MNREDIGWILARRAFAARKGEVERAPDGFWESPPPREIPDALAVKHSIFPLRVEGGRVYAATANPYDLDAADEVRYATGLLLVPLAATREDIERALRRWYLGAEEPGAGEEEKPEEEDTAADDNPVARLVARIIEDALAEGASDIHVEPQRSGARVRYRVDGVLRDTASLPLGLQRTFVRRVKVMAGLDIAEQRLPQDGRITLGDRRGVDLRVSTLPTVFGEKVVIRVLDKSRLVPELEALGYSGNSLAALRAAAFNPYGLILVTGPTGSGKTTTLYALLKEIVNPGINVVTVEDPPEYELEGVNQVAVNTKAGLTFAMALRAILRQDPDVVMVGEIRDPETAKIAVQAALTGHLVLSTLHTNDAASAPVRLVDMGVEPYLVASCLLCVVAQRLVRTICSECSISYTPPPDSPVWGFLGGSSYVPLKRGKGCSACRGAGLRGRTAVAEVMLVGPRLRRLIRESADSDMLRAAAVEEGMLPLAEDAVQKVLAGVTTPEEAMRIVVSAES